MWHLESLLAVLQVQPVWAVPVTVNDICLSVAVKVGQRHTSPVLIPVFNTCHHTITHESEGGLWISAVNMKSGLTCLGGHVCEGAVTVALEQEVGSIFIVTKNIRACVAEDRTHNYTTATLWNNINTFIMLIFHDKKLH